MLLHEAVALHRAGRLADAEAKYDVVLARDPHQGDALNLKGLIALDRGRTTQAVELLERAAKAAPSNAPLFFNYGNALGAAGFSERAIAAYQRAIRLQPAFVDAHINLGVLLDSLGRLSEAIEAFRHASRIGPNDVRAHRNLALCLIKLLKNQQGSPREALVTEISAAFEHARRLAPNDPDILFDFGNFLAEQQEHARAIAQYEAALTLKPDWPEVLSNLGESLRHDGRIDEAITMQRRALSLRPGNPDMRAHLANALQQGAHYDEADRIYREMSAEDPNSALPYIYRGNLCRDQGRTDEAIAMYEEALFHSPDFHEVYSNLGSAFAEEGWTASSYVLHQKAVASKDATAETRLSLAIVSLSLGRFAEGWAGYEYRFESSSEDLHRRPLPPPYWRGEDLGGKKIFIWTEQGIGDEILYAQMIPDLIARNARCLIACSKRMVPIYARSFPECVIVGYNNSALDVLGGDEFDYQLPIASLGPFFRNDFRSFPQRTGYLKADPEKVRCLRARYEELARGRRIVGLSWRSKARNGSAKSLSPLDLAPLLTTRDVFFVNLQYGDCSADIAEVRDKTGVEIYNDPSVDSLSDMDGFFAQVAALDLVITTSNTAAHTAGAQNIPVWVLLPYARGVPWYWFRSHSRSPWYPSARLIRQTKATFRQPWWEEVLAETAKRLMTLDSQAF